jgi:aminoglycoside phosphotransferase family enzyme/predicted kinase
MHRAGAATIPIDSGFIESLLNPAAYAHPVSSVELVETHISWVLLASEYVYKIKKPIALDFLDFSSLERRKFYCDEEIRLNRPFAPEIYVDVVPITMEDGQPCIGASGTPIEYAVRMRRFDQAMRLDAQLEQGKLSVRDMKELARNIAERHTAASVIDESQRDHVIAVTKEFMFDNLAALDGFIDEPELGFLREWTELEIKKLEPELRQRFDDGFVRDCHGDLHLANLVRLPRGITTFDCIEFSTDLRHIDVTCDIAFLIMDLVARKRHDLAAHFLNRYLECTGDYECLRLMSLYFVYRCLVLAKVAAIRSQEREQESERDADLAEVRDYCEMAKRQIKLRTPILIVMSGLSGSGKTWLSTQIMAAIPAIRIRSDTERKRAFGLSETADSASDVGQGIYAPHASREIYAYLLKTAEMILVAGHSVILDAAFLSVSDRDAAIRMAKDCGRPPVLLEVTAPSDVLRDRIRQRSIYREDASEAGLNVLEYQIANAEPLTADEKEIAIVCSNAGDADVPAMTARIKALADN